MNISFRKWGYISKNHYYLQGYNNKEWYPFFGMFQNEDYSSFLPFRYITSNGALRTSYVAFIESFKHNFAFYNIKVKSWRHLNIRAAKYAIMINDELYMCLAVKSSYLEEFSKLGKLADPNQLSLLIKRDFITGEYKSIYRKILKECPELNDFDHIVSNNIHDKIFTKLELPTFDSITDRMSFYKEELPQYGKC